MKKALLIACMFFDPHDLFCGAQRQGVPKATHKKPIQQNVSKTHCISRGCLFWLIEQTLRQKNNPNKSPAPHCHTSSAELRRQFKQQFNDFVDAYKQAYVNLAKGLFKLEFPEGSIPPTAWAAA